MGFPRSNITARGFKGAPVLITDEVGGFTQSLREPNQLEAANKVHGKYAPCKSTGSCPIRTGGGSKLADDGIIYSPHG